MIPLDVQDALLVEALRRGPVTMVLKGRSMSPCIPHGARVELVPLLGSLPRLGDVILCAHQGRLVAHRMVGWKDNQLVLQGDSHRVPDAPIPLEDALARVVAWTWKGRRMDVDANDAWAWRLGGRAYRTVHRMYAWLRDW